MRHNEYFIEINTCDYSNGKAFRKFGYGLRTPKTTNGLLCDVILLPMDRLVTDPGRLGHFVFSEKTIGFIAQKNVSFEKLNIELPKRDKNLHAREEAKKDKAEDSVVNEENGLNLFKDRRDIVDCSQCKFSRCIFGKCSLKSSKLKLSKQQQEMRRNEIEVFKEEGCVWGDQCEVKGHYTERTLRCGDYVETQHYTFGETNKDNEKIIIISRACRK